jgi:hypothetical protein
VQAPRLKEPVYEGAESSGYLVVFGPRNTSTEDNSGEQGRAHWFASACRPLHFANKWSGFCSRGPEVPPVAGTRICPKTRSPGRAPAIFTGVAFCRSSDKAEIHG